MSKNYHPNAKVTIETLVESYSRHSTWAGVAEEVGIDVRSVSRRLTKHFAVEEGHTNLDEDIPNYHPGAGRVLTHVSKQLDKNGNPQTYHVKEQAKDDKENYTHPLDNIKRVSTYRGADGQINGQWTITTKDDHQTAKAFDDIVAEFKKDIPRNPVNLNIPVKPRRGQILVTESVPPLVRYCILSATYIAAKFNPS